LVNFTDSITGDATFVVIVVIIDVVVVISFNSDFETKSFNFSFGSYYLKIYNIINIYNILIIY